MSWIIAALIVPIPILHFWLHALLPWWRKRPILFYLWCSALFGISFWLFFGIAKVSFKIFLPMESVQWIGIFLMVIGVAAVLSSIFTLGIRRFFLWEVFRPSKINIRVTSGLYRLIPHPAYFGYLAAALGNLFLSSELYAIVAFLFLLTLTPIVIWLEEKELRERLFDK